MKLRVPCSHPETSRAVGRPGSPLGTPAGNAQLTKAQLEIVFRAAHKTGCQSMEVSVVLKSISLHYLAIFRQILTTILPSYLFKAPPIMRLTFFWESELFWGGWVCMC